MLVINLALRNLFRNRQRTILSLSLIALGVTALFLFRGFSEDIRTTIRGSAINQVGHIQIATAAYWEGERYGYDYLISPDILAKVKKILAEEPQIISYSTRLDLEGLVATEQKSGPFQAVGVEPVRPVPDMEIKEGRRLEAGDRQAMLLSPSLAEELGVEVDDHLVVTTVTVYGLDSTGNVEVIGIYRPGGIGGIGGITVITPVYFIQMMRDTDRIARMAVKLTHERATEEVALHLQRALEENDLRGLEVRTWWELAPAYHFLGLFLDSIFGFVSVVILLLVFFSVLEGLTMAFFERIQEIGAMRAIGTKRHHVFGMFLNEGMILGLLSGLLGVALGWGIGALINVAGLTWISPLHPDPLPFRIALGLDIARVPFLVALGATAISAIYPAYRAAKLEIANALRFV